MSLIESARRWSVEELTGIRFGVAGLLRSVTEEGYATDVRAIMESGVWFGTVDSALSADDGGGVESMGRRWNNAMRVADRLQHLVYKFRKIRSKQSTYHLGHPAFSGRECLTTHGVR